MKGTNTIIVNQETLRIALEQYLERVFVLAVEVGEVLTEGSTGTAVRVTFQLKDSDPRPALSLHPELDP